MKKIALLLIALPMMASESYREIFEHFPQDSEIRRLCVNLDNNYYRSTPNIACKQVGDILKGIKNQTHSYTSWDYALHAPVAVLLDTNHSAKKMDSEHAYAEGLAKAFTKIQLDPSFDRIYKFHVQNTECYLKHQRMQYAHKFAKKSHPGVGKHFLKKYIDEITSKKSIKSVKEKPCCPKN